MYSTFLFTATFLAATAGAALAFTVLPSKTLDKRAATQCGQWDTIVTGAYTLYADLWGEAAASSGSQCSTVDSVTGDTIAWSTSWSWAGGSSSVKSYTNAVISQSTGYQVSSISSIPTVWEYRYTGENIVADVSYDMFTSSTATGPHEYEIMIWLAALGGAGPISSTGSPVATPTINGISWKLFSGRNGDTTVYSFVAVSQVTSFSGDIKLFFTWLAANEGFSTSQYVTSIGAGTEPFTGTDAVLTVNAYSISFNLGVSSGTATVSSTPKVTTTSTAKATSTKCAKVTSTTAAAVASTPGASLYGQCGGIGWKGPKTCDSGTCTYSNAWYSQCLA